MSTKTVFINQQKVKLDAADLIQAGGEGLVFAHGRDQVIKLYHQPRDEHRAKLEYIWHNNLGYGLPAAVYWPHTAVTDAQQTLLGFTMPRLADEWQPIKRLGNPNFVRRHGLQLPQIVAILRHAWRTLHALHQHDILVGDLNDHNIFFHPQNHETAWLDTDSYQVGPHPCPVALQPFLDPQLYHVTDFAQRPVFTPESDWYAFFVLVVKSLLYVHPYGGTHHIHKTLSSRAEHRISLLNGAVTYPQQARPLNMLSDDLLTHMHRIFDKGERRLFPRRLLDDYAQSLQACPHCEQHFPSARSHCPHCQQANQQAALPASYGRGQIKTHLLFQTAGHIDQVWLHYENLFAGQRRFRAIVRQDRLYTLIYAGLAGQVSEMPLFVGQPDYQFSYFAGHLVVNPPGRNQLLVLDVSGLDPKRLGLLETEAFGGTAVFATTPNHLYRLANGYIMQASVRDGHLLEEVVGTAYPQQTRLWGSPYNDMLAGIYRSFGHYTFFYRTPAGEWHEYPLALAPDESVQEMHVVFNHNGRDADLFLHTRHQGHTRYKSSIYAPAQAPLALPECPPFQTPPAYRDDTLYFATAEGLLQERGHLQSQILQQLCDPHTAVVIPLNPHHQLHAHGRGVLVQTDQHVFLVEC